MRFLIAISGPIAVGKSASISGLARRFGAIRISTREIIQSLRSVPSERGPLQAAGEALDRETDGAWVADAIAARSARFDQDAIVIVDSVRIAKQVEKMRTAFHHLVQHVHLTASIEVLSRRFLIRKEQDDPAVRDFSTYDEARQNATEADIEKLGNIADWLIDTDQLDPDSVATLAAERIGLLPKS